MTTKTSLSKKQQQDKLQQEYDQKLIEAKAVLSTIMSGTTHDTPENDPSYLFNKQVNLLIGEKFKLGWSKRQVKRYIKRELDLDINL